MQILTLRKIIFYVAVIIYLVLCPLIIFYAVGYIVKPRMQKPFVKTGVIYLSTLPPRASIYLNGKISPSLTPAVLGQLSPGSYKVDLFLEGYEVWNETLSVKAEEATVLDKILLIPKTWKKALLIKGKFEDLLPFPGTQFLLAAGERQLKGHLIYDTKNDKTRPLLPGESQYAAYSVLSPFTVKGSPFLLLHVSSQEQEKFLWFDLTAEEAEPLDITDLFPEKPIRVIWDPQDGNTLFSFHGNSIDKIDLKAKALYPDYVADVRGLGVSQNTLYALKKKGVLISMNYDKSGLTKILDEPALGESIFGDTENFRITAFTKEIILFEGDAGELLANRLPYKFIERGLGGLDFDTPRERVLLWLRGGLGILDFSAEETGDVAFEKPPALVRVFTGGKNIRQAFWVYEGSHIMFLDGDEIFLLGLGEYIAPRLSNLFKVKPGTPIFYSEDAGCVYFINAASGNLMASRIRADRSDFPEAFSEEEKGKIKELSAK